MIKKVKTNEGIQYKKLSPEEMKERGILGRLIGPCADFNNATRNGRKYSEQLWENVFNDPIMQEKIKNGVCFGELGHPEDRTEIDMEKIAVCLREQPVKNEKGQLCAVFDILDTPNGRILKTLCDYGSTVGVSSRGQGDIITDANGDEAVDPDTYECECWDVVLVPAVESARMKYVTEDLNTNVAKMKKALTESLNNATEEDKKVMKETLEELNIKLTEDKVTEAKEEGLEAWEAYGEVTEIDKSELDKNELQDLKDLESQAGIKVVAILHSDDPDLDNRYIGDDNEAYIGSWDRSVHGWLWRSVSLDELAETNESLTEAKEDGEGEAETAEEKIPAESDASEEVTFTADEVKEVATDVATEIAPEEPKEKIEATAEEKVSAAAEEKAEEKAAEGEESEEEILVSDAEEGEEPVEEPAEEAASEIAEGKVCEKCGKNPCECVKEECIDESRADIKEEAKEVVEESATAVDDGDAVLIKSLQEALKSKSDLEGSVKSLQEKLAVSDTKVNELTEENNNYKKAIARLATMSKSNKDLKESVTKLEESLKEKDAMISEQQERIARLVKSRQESVSESASLNESIESKKSEITTLTEDLTKSKDEVKTLNEKLSDSDKQMSELNENLTKATTLKEAYKKLANRAVNKYIDIKAQTLGLTSADIKRKLGESYTLEDVDQVCEDLKAYQLNVSKLPFSIDRKVGIRVNEGVNKLSSKQNKSYDDDDVDESLIKLAGF